MTPPAQQGMTVAMIRVRRPLLVALAGITVLAACAPEDPSLMNFRRTGTPDEFAIVPALPLQPPPEVAALPPPTPGADNRADPNPEADAVAALGGNPEALARTGVPAADGGLVNHTSRYGRDPTIRDQLAEEDLAYRQSNRGRILERWFNINRYHDSYRGQTLNQHSELDRFRDAGLRTPAAPPDPLFLD